MEQKSHATCWLHVPEPKIVRKEGNDLPLFQDQNLGQKLIESWRFLASKWIKQLQCVNGVDQHGELVENL